MRGGIPFVLSIDVEPHGFQLDGEPARALQGADALVELVARLRPKLERTTGTAPSFGWFFRMDPQIEDVYGDAAHLVAGFGPTVHELVDAGDHVGLHTHPLRRPAGDGTWVHDVSDPDWIRHVIHSSFAAFERYFGTRCERHRMGAALFNQDIVDALQHAGARVESAIEPNLGAGAEGRDIQTGVDSSPMLGRARDCVAAPRRPYRPSPRDFLHADRREDGLVLLPITSTWLWPARPGWRTIAVNAVKWRRRPPARMLYLGDRMSPMRYWDLVARQLRLMRRPYVNVAIRADAPGTEYFERACAVLEALPDHPLAHRIEVADPLRVVTDLLSGSRATTATPVD